MKKLIRLLFKTLLVGAILILPFAIVGIVMKHKILQIILGIIVLLLVKKEIKEAK